MNLSVEPDTNEATADELRRQIDGVQALIGRADTKAQALFAVHSLAMAGAVALVKTSAPSALLTTSAILFGAALIVTLYSVLPRLGRAVGTGLVDWARMSPSELLQAAQKQDASAADQAAHLARLSRIGVRKMRLVQIGVWMLIAGVVVVAGGLVL